MKWGGIKKDMRYEWHRVFLWCPTYFPLDSEWHWMEWAEQKLSRVTYNDYWCYREPTK